MHGQIWYQGQGVRRANATLSMAGPWLLYRGAWNEDSGAVSPLRTSPWTAALSAVSNPDMGMHDISYMSHGCNVKLSQP